MSNTDSRPIDHWHGVVPSRTRRGDECPVCCTLAAGLTPAMLTDDGRFPLVRKVTVTGRHYDVVIACEVCGVEFTMWGINKGHRLDSTCWKCMPPTTQRANVRTEDGATLTYLVPVSATVGDMVMCPPTYWQGDGRVGVVVETERDSTGASFYDGECREARIVNMAQAS